MIQRITQREYDVLQHLILGKSNKHIAGELGISHHTVRDHITSIMAKFGVRNRVELSLKAYEKYA
jgi:two-component system nitrate/nitrite response regulator NarL